MGLMWIALNILWKPEGPEDPTVHTAKVAAKLDEIYRQQRNAARLKPLYAEKAVSQKELDDAVSAEAIGEADLKAARARRDEARLNLGYTKVESPIAGMPCMNAPPTSGGESAKPTPPRVQKAVLSKPPFSRSGPLSPNALPRA